MKIEIKGLNNVVIKDRIKKMINDNEIRTWKFVKEEYTRLMHNGDEQYEDVVLMFKSKDGDNSVDIIPKVRDGVKDKETAESHFGVVMGRFFAELLNCHFPDLESYRTFI